MKFLLDQNLSPRLVQRFCDDYPGSTHVRDVGLGRAPDTKVWEWAREHGFVIVSKDSDFHQRSFLLGHPPKVIWLRIGNCTTAQVEQLLHRHQEEIDRFGHDESASFLTLA